MAKGGEVLAMLIPAGGWVITADDFESIIYDEGVAPITRKQFDDGFAQFDAWQAQQDQAKANEKAAILERLGITAEEVLLLLG
tara:strand:+ start:237 stop:485 length:249 start_codon:yes stop_codon:yes gene_type:complete